MYPNARYGEQNGRAKLTEQIVREIRLNPEGLSQQKRAEKYGVNRTTIQKIENYTFWPNVE